MLTLVSLKLNDVSVIGILNDASVAVELLLEILEHQFLVDLRVESLHRRQALTSVTLLHANVNVVLLNRVRGFLLFLFWLFFVSKVKRFVSKGIVGCVSRIRRAPLVSLSFASSSSSSSRPIPRHPSSSLARLVRDPRASARVVVSRALVRRRDPSIDLRPHSSRARRVVARARRSAVARDDRASIDASRARPARARAAANATTFTPKRSIVRRSRSRSRRARARARATRAAPRASTRSTHRTLSRRP